SLYNVDINSSEYSGYRPGTAYLYQVSSYPGIYWVILSLLKTFNSGYNSSVDYFGQSLSIGRGNYIISNHNKGNDVKPGGIGAVRFGSVD
ncbi:MAG TPA: hypothetical protein VFX58_09420, partial [Chitinophagaceae bacterium]|nr:hypothetical protein [Chitinophagaceae bacterium]